MRKTKHRRWTKWQDLQQIAHISTEMARRLCRHVLKRGFQKIRAGIFHNAPRLWTSADQQPGNGCQRNWSGKNCHQNQQSKSRFWMSSKSRGKSRRFGEYWKNELRPFSLATIFSKTASRTGQREPMGGFLWADLFSVRCHSVENSQKRSCMIQ